jgi:pimeloyl-ACP methyl ester carboxylesterase
MDAITRRAALAVAVAPAALAALPAAAASEPRFEDGYVDNDGVKIHYAAVGKGPPVVFVHGFPDFWLTWKPQMLAVAAKGYRAVAIDQRGYNLSDKPQGDQNYAMPKMVSDVAAVIRAVGGRAALVGHDWGGVVSWTTTYMHPELIERLAILNLPHPNGLSRELAIPDGPQQHASVYAQNFKKPGAAKTLSAEALAHAASTPETYAAYVEAFKRSDIDAMLAYYRVNYPSPPYAKGPDLPPLKLRTLLVHGLKDTALLAPAIDGTWRWIDAPFETLTLPDAGHFVQRDAAEEVSLALTHWLSLPPLKRA